MQIWVIVKESIHRDRQTGSLLGSVIELKGAYVDVKTARRVGRNSIPADMKVQQIGFHGYQYQESGFPEGHLVEVNLTFRFTEL